MRTHRSALLCGTAVLALAGTLAGAPSASAAVAETNCNYIADSARPTVRPNDKGNAVRQVQCLINYYSKYSDWLEEDGDYGPATAQGVYWVQTCNGTTGGADGIVGSSTWSRLYTPKPACAL
ncbi:peptidoglycan-binding protein [Streptomyces sp. NBC_00878]|uniref:peptidoglycan-binding domain-containing protein n=1 Tax=Streptomyces sp. NBC_00878 TaxID=2975854 RepID=UPI002255C057|nr:peptidoglycan-binding protein [Streptomyces sp. NBC_00878]MCX4911574.1 peptidoglycan-binding protein [Streptomyces sp. NBC_00878]